MMPDEDLDLHKEISQKNGKYVDKYKSFFLIFKYLFNR